MNETKLMELTKRRIDLKKEKKDYDAEMNKNIKEIEAEIALLVRDSEK